MKNKVIEAGFGQLLSFISGNVSLAPVTNNISNANKSGASLNDYLKVAVSTSQSAASYWEMTGKSFPLMNIAGKKIPISGGFLQWQG